MFCFPGSTEGEDLLYFCGLQFGFGLWLLNTSTALVFPRRPTFQPMPIKNFSKLHISYFKLPYRCSSNATLPLLAQAGGSTGSAKLSDRKFSRYCSEFRHTTFTEKKLKVK